MTSGSLPTKEDLDKTSISQRLFPKKQHSTVDSMKDRSSGIVTNTITIEGVQVNNFLGSKTAAINSY